VKEKEISDAKAVTHHQQTDAKPVFKQQILYKNSPPSFIAEYDVIQYGI